MKSIRHTKLAILVSTLILVIVAITACALGATGNVEDNADVDISASAMEVHALLASGLSFAELEAELGVTAENIQNAYDGRRNVYRFNLMTTPGYVNPSISDGVIDWHGLRDGLVRIIAHIQYETFTGNIFHSVIYSPSVGRAYIIRMSGERTDTSDMLDTPMPQFDSANVSSYERCDHGGLSIANMIHRATPLNMLAFSTRADDDIISNFIDSFGHIHEVNAVRWEADWHHTLVFWVDTAVRNLSLEILGETVVTITSPSHDEAIVVKVAPMHYLQPCGAIIITEENGTQHRIYFIQDMGADMICLCFWPYVLLPYNGSVNRGEELRHHTPPLHICTQITHTHIKSSANDTIQIGNLQITVREDVKVIVYDYGVGVTLFPVRAKNTSTVDTYLSSLEFSRLNSNCGYPVPINYVYIGDERTPISILPPLSPDEPMYFYLPIEAFVCENVAWYRPFAISETITDYTNDHATVIHYVFKICLRDECPSGTCW